MLRKVELASRQEALDMTLRPRRHRTDKFGRRLVASGVEGASQHLQRFRFIGDALKSKTSRLDFLECGSCPIGEAESALALDRPFKARDIGLQPRSGFPGRAPPPIDQDRKSVVSGKREAVL